jgi:DNA-binding transcriptional LysR family regulator
MRGPLELDLLQTLVAIVESGSFASAALRIHRTQSAVSMQMRRLELIAGKPIFDRDGRRARLTPAGETLLAYARRILKLQTEAFSILGDAELAGTVRLGTPDDYVEALLPGILMRFAADHPQVEVMLRCEPSADLRKLVMSGELDLALVTKSPAWNDVEQLRREPLVWVASTEFNPQTDPIPVALFQPGCTTRDLALKALAKSGRTYRIAYTSPNLSGLLAVVRAGLAVTAVARCSVPHDLEILGVSDNLPKLPEIEIGILKAQRYSKPAIALAECIADNIEPNDWYVETENSPELLSI